MFIQNSDGWILYPLGRIYYLLSGQRGVRILVKLILAKNNTRKIPVPRIGINDKI